MPYSFAWGVGFNMGWNKAVVRYGCGHHTRTSGAIMVTSE